MNHKCMGCGISLQTEAKDEVGYANKIDAELCQRCYRLKNFNETPNIKLTNDTFLDILKNVADEKGLIVWVVDLFDFNGTYIEMVKNIIKDNPIILVGNKRDLLPKPVSNQKLINWLDQQIAEDVNLVDIMIMSAKKKQNIDQLLDLVKYYGKDKATVIGVTNTGKSTIINQIVKSVDPSRESKVLTSYYAGTTLAKIDIPVTKKVKITDTPGIINDGQIYNYVTKDTLKVIMPKKEVRPITFQLNPEQTLFVSGLMQMDFVKGPRSSFTIYMSNELTAHRTKLSNAKEFRQRHLGTKLLCPPTTKEMKTINEYKTVKLDITKSKTDIVISGLGWITVNKISGPLAVSITVPKQIAVNLRDSII